MREDEKEEILDKIECVNNSILESQHTEKLLLSSEITDEEASIIKRFYKQVYDNRLNYIKDLYEIINTNTNLYVE